MTYDAPNDAGNDVSTGEIDFGDDSGTWANDGECDDPRFGGNLDSHLMADATDCREAHEAGTVTYQAPDNAGSDVSIDDIDFGDNSGNWANDGECDDPRFGGSLDSHLMADATDCREAYEAGTVTYETTDNAGSDVSIGDIDFGDDSGNWANDGECDDPRFGGGLDSHRLAVEELALCREGLADRADDVRGELGREGRLRRGAVGDLVDGGAHREVDAAREGGLERVEGELVRGRFRVRATNRVRAS